MMSQEYNLEDQTYVIFNDDPETFERNTNVAEHQLTDFKLFSLRLEQELPFATLTAIASSVEKTGDLAFDYSIFGGNDPRTDTPLLAFGLGESSTDFLELRLASKNANNLEWQVGLNLTNLESKSTGANYIEGIADYVDSNPDDFDGQAGSVLAPDDFAERTDSSNDVSEKAIFGELTYHISEALSLTVGGRLFEYEISNTLDFLPNTDLIDPFSFTPDEANESGFIPKIAASYDINDDFLIYSSYSEGFRIGGVNVYSAANTDLPLTFNSDSTSNFEIGTKFELFNGKAKFDATIYHIEWDDIQARLFTPDDFKAYTVNGGGADINGVELSIDLKLTEALYFNTSISYNDAELSEFLPDTFAVGGGYASGTQLPGASDLILASTITMNLDGELEPTISLSHRYLSKAPVAFGASFEKGGYNIVDLNASAMISDEMQVSIFVKNLGDTYGILSAPFSFAGSVTRPRTVGASFRYDF
jgi:outer membrane receptor protein involved in Fe transport